MIQPITKQVTISDPPESHKDLFVLETADGRHSLAERLMIDIDEWCKQAFDDGPRSHLGASIIGRPCDRDIWYTWRWFKRENFGARMLRLFQDGHWYEERFIEMLRGIGLTVEQVADDGSQQRIVFCGGHGHGGGSCDGTATLPKRYGEMVAKYGPFLLEFKTINTGGFRSFHDVKESKPEHWGQMCTYGVKMGIRYALYFIVNKNDADMYIEVVELDWNHGNMLIQKGEWIIFSPVPPPRLSDNPSDYRCKMCHYHGVCHLKVQADVNCRSCRYAEALPNKEWRCNRWSAIIPSKEAMIAACEAYEVLPTE
jgi:hypothetical protein